MKTRYFVGHKPGERIVVALDHIPTMAEFPGIDAFVGPFKTKRAALWAASAGAQNNPHYQHVNDAEKIAKAINWK